MNKKIRKTLYLPEWLADILDSEGDAYDGPGIVAAASIHSFSKMDKKNKISSLQNYRSKEIEVAYKQDISEKDKSAVIGVTLADFTLHAEGVLSEERLQELWESTPKKVQKSFIELFRLVEAKDRIAAKTLVDDTQVHEARTRKKKTDKPLKS